jgi:cell division protein ZapA (FtsZ GTPase activity inhibitor)
MTAENLADGIQELHVMVLDRPMKIACFDSGMDLDAALNVLNETFRDMERLYGLKYKCSPSALDTSTWMLTGALNLAHRVLCLEREAALQARDMEEPISKLLDSIPDDVIPNGFNTSDNRPLSVE